MEAVIDELPVVYARALRMESAGSSTNCTGHCRAGAGRARADTRCRAALS